MSRLASSRNVQWSKENATNWVYSWAQDIGNLSSLRSGYIDERTKKMKEIFLRKMKCVFVRKTEASYLMTGPLIDGNQPISLPHSIKENGFRIYFQF